jgi:hypothetical protein
VSQRFENNLAIEIVSASEVPHLCVGDFVQQLQSSLLVPFTGTMNDNQKLATDYSSRTRRATTLVMGLAKISARSSKAPMNENGA